MSTHPITSDQAKKPGTNRGKAFHQVKAGKLLGGNGCPLGGPSCFECPLPDCERDSSETGNYRKINI